MNTQVENKCITFVPAMQCSGSECDALTGFALVSNLSDPQGLSFLPLCERHGLAFATGDLADEYRSVAKYAEWEHQGVGKATVLGDAPLDSIPGYTPEGDARFDDRAWAILYTDEQGQEHHEFVLWLVDCLCFELVGQAAQ